MNLYKEYYQLKKNRYELTNQLKKLNETCTVKFNACTQARINETLELLENNSIRMHILEKITNKGFV